MSERKDIRVRATQEGHYGGYFRETGAEFDLVDEPPGAAEQAFSDSWMERVDAPPPRKAAAPKSKPEAKTPSRSVI